MLSPPPSLRRHLYSLVIGSAAGATVGLVGWGGAQIIIPAMAWPNPAYAGLTQLAATGVCLASLSVSTATSGWEYWRKGSVDAPLAATIGASSALSAQWGTRLARRLSGRSLALVFDGLSMVFIPTHYWIQCRAEARRKASSSDAPLREHSVGEAKVVKSPKQAISLNGDRHIPDTSALLRIPTIACADLLQHVAFGTLSGIVSALMGVGGLPLTVSYITEASGIEHHKVQGTAICAVIPAVVMSAISRMNVVPPVTAAVVSVGAATGGCAGAKAALYLSEDTLRHLYMGSLVILGGRSVFGAGKNITSMVSGKTK